MTRVGVFGSRGRMGAEVCRAVDSAPDLELVAALDLGMTAPPPRLRRSWSTSLILTP